MASDALTTVQLEAMLTAYVGGLTTPKIVLFTNNIQPTPDTAFGDLVLVPTAGWYSPATAVFGAVYKNDDSSVSSSCPSHQFTGDGTNVATVYGYAVTDGATTLYSAASLANPVTINSADSAVIVEPMLTLASVNQS